MADSKGKRDAMTKKAAKLSAGPPQNELRVVCAEGDDPAVATAIAVISPYMGNGLALQVTNQKTLGQDLALQHYTEALVKGAKAIQGNDLREIEAMLYAQGLALNAIFTNLAVKSAQNFNGGSQYTAAGSDYLKLALKAQNQSRMTFETLAAVKNPPVVYARQANINNGGNQQVNNGTKPASHTAKKENPPSKVLEQTDEQRVDSGAEGKAVTGDPALEAVAQGHRS